MSAAVMPDAPEAAEAPQTATEIQGGEKPQGSETSTTKPVAEKPKPEDLLDGMSEEEMESLLGDPDPELFKPKGEKPEGDEEEEEPEGEEEEEEEPEGELKSEDEPEGEEEEPEQKEEKLARRVRITTDDPKKQKFLKLMRENPDADPIDLAKVAGYKGPEAKEEAARVTEQPKEEKRVTVEEALKPLDDEITALEKQRDDALEAFEHSKAIKLTEQITEKKMERREKAKDFVAQQEWKRSYDADFKVAHQKAVGRYPDVAKPGTRQFKLVKAEIARRLQDDPEFNQDPNFPNTVIDDLEKELPEIFNAKAAKPKGKTSPAETPPKTQLPPARKVMGKSTAPGSSTTEKPHSKAELNQMLDNLSPEELESLADEAGFKPPRGPMLGMGD